MFCVCVCVWGRWRLACRGSALISHGLSSATSDRPSIRTLCTTSPCLLQLVVSPGPMSPRLPWWPRPSSHSWMVGAQLARCFWLRLPGISPLTSVSLSTRSRPPHAGGLVERHDVRVSVKPQRCPAAWVSPLPHGCLHPAARLVPGGAGWSRQGVGRSAAHGGAVSTPTLPAGRGDTARSIIYLLFKLQD